VEQKETPVGPSCAACQRDIFDRICIDAKGKGSRGCPTLTRNKVRQDANREYHSPQIREFARQASIQEGECYANRGSKPYVVQPTKTRIVEICEFAQKMVYRRLGLAFCIGLVKEAATVQDILISRGFEVISAMCKAGRTSKESIGITEEEKVFPGMDEPMCNPVYQAKLFNHEKTQFNILLGLCVGHDSLFFQYAEAPTTVLAVKDRVTGHNPLVAIYQADSYYEKIRHPGL